MDPYYLKTLFSGCNDIVAILRDVQAEKQRLQENLQRNTQGDGVDIEPLLSENKELTDQFMKLEERLGSVSNLINAELKQEYEECHADFNNLFAKKEIFSNSLAIINFVLQANEKINVVEELISTECSLQNCESLRDCELHVMNWSHLENLKMYQQLQKRLQELRTVLVSNLSKKFEEGIFFERKDNLIRICVKNNYNFQETLSSFEVLNEFHVINNLLTAVNKDALLNIIHFKSTVHVESNLENKVLLIRIDFEQSSFYVDVFKQITQILEFLAENVNFSLKNGDTIITLLRKIMEDNFVENTINKCFCSSVPNHMQKNDVKEIQSNAELFQASLKTLNFLSPDSNAILEEVEKIGYILANKTHERSLEAARATMKKELHSKVPPLKLSTPDWSAFPSSVFQVIESEFHLKTRNSFGSCKQISKSAQDILDLVEEIFLTSDDVPEDIIRTVRNIFELYCAIVPLHHKRFLSEIPHIQALFHNNCLHFSHYLLYRASWAANLQSEYHILLDEATALARLAEDSLVDYITSQRLQILEIVDESGLSKLQNEAILDPNTERHIRQSIRLIQILKNVWIDVLPDFVYTSKISYLATALTETVVRRIVNLNDISVKLSTDLTQILSVLEERLSQLLTGIDCVSPSNRHWNRLIKLKLILNYNLDEISNGWHMGRGPLAKSFEKWEVMNLVRAIFRNTEKRSTVLNIINTGF